MKDKPIPSRKPVGGHDNDGTLLKNQSVDDDNDTSGGVMQGEVRGNLRMRGGGGEEEYNNQQ